MSIFGNILDKIFKHKPGAAPAAAQGQATPPPAAPTIPPPVSPAAAAPAPQAQIVDVEAVLVEMASLKGGGGNWRVSIVDLLALLDLENSMSARHDLAEELGVRAGADGTAEQNIALHKAVMKKLAENGGVVPDNMRD
ncbi:hypothetical protein ACFB49_06190 [Sphingomonas sp. DBB INV C78]|uniref:DUF3597 domain-containing protein n=1 Tax=Sphingomonas sp. DBB INV C78 TaxID=3349434 RepID=UPI0036D29DD1